MVTWTQKNFLEPLDTFLYHHLKIYVTLCEIVTEIFGHFLGSEAEISDLFFESPRVGLFRPQMMYHNI